MSAKYILTNDSDGHWFVIPADREDEFNTYLEAAYRFWDDMPDDQDPPIQPDWAEEVGGAPSLVKFSEYEIE